MLQAGKPHTAGAWSGWPRGMTPRSQPGAEVMVDGPHGQETHWLWPARGRTLLVEKGNVT